jgi:FtsH-binding integral membrane protein
VDLSFLTNITFVGLAVLGIVNVITIFKPGLDSKYKFLISVVAAFALTFVPASLGSILLDKMKIALEVAFAASGAYKMAQKAGSFEPTEK